MRLIVTGGAGFIGSAVIRHLIKNTNCCVLNIDKLTYASSLSSLQSVSQSSKYRFSQTDICDAKKISKLISGYKPNAILHLAAESHVDRSIDGPAEFIKTNILGTYTLLEQVASYWKTLSEGQKNSFRFYHVSTDEVYGDMAEEAEADERTAYAPSSPYSATKASSDHLVRAWHRTYGLPILVSNCTNNYGPYQFPEKLIPLMILSALENKRLPVYGDGAQIRDWLYVEDHAEAIVKILFQGEPGETYNISGYNEIKNIDVVVKICEILDGLIPSSKRSVKSYKELITFVEDRPGHDKRYALNSHKLKELLGWTPKETFETGLYRTVQWYMESKEWLQDVNGQEVCGNRVGLDV